MDGQGVEGPWLTGLGLEWAVPSQLSLTDIQWEGKASVGQILPLFPPKALSPDFFV